MQNKEEEEKTKPTKAKEEDEWTVFDELDQTIDEVTNNGKQKKTVENYATIFRGFCFD